MEELELTEMIAPVAEWRPVLAIREPHCRVCMGTHDDEIHAATLSIRQWFRGEVTKYFLVEDSLVA